MDPASIPIHYVPSSEKFADFIAMGIGYGMMPHQQGSPLSKNCQLIDLMPDTHVPVELYWHCWNLKSKLVEQFSSQLFGEANWLLGDFRP